MTERRFSCDTEGLAGAQAFLESVCEEPKPAVVMDEIVSNIVRCSGAKAFTVQLDEAPEHRPDETVVGSESDDSLKQPHRLKG